MKNLWSPHPRYRLYTRMASYRLPLKQLSIVRDSAEATRRLEEEVRCRFKVAAAVCVPMARTGLWLTLREMIRPGQSVVMSPFTIIDVVNMVVLAGGIPVFADIRKTSYGSSPLSNSGAPPMVPACDYTATRGVEEFSPFETGRDGQLEVRHRTSRCRARFLRVPRARASHCISSRVWACRCAVRPLIFTERVNLFCTPVRQGSPHAYGLSRRRNDTSVEIYS
jgi:hypothetical protein